MSILVLQSSMGRRELIALLNLSSWCLAMVERPFPRGCLRFVIVVFPDHTHLQFFIKLLTIFRLFLRVYHTCSVCFTNINIIISRVCCDKQLNLGVKRH